METLISVLAIFGASVIVLFGLAWLAVVIAFLEPSVHDDLLLDGEDFDNKAKGKLGR